MPRFKTRVISYWLELDTLPLVVNKSYDELKRDCDNSGCVDTDLSFVAVNFAVRDLAVVSPPPTYPPCRAQFILESHHISLAFCFQLATMIFP